MMCIGAMTLAGLACEAKDQTKTTAEGVGRYAPMPPSSQLRLCDAFDAPETLAGAKAPQGREVRTIWGDAALADPWRGPIVVVIEKDGDKGYAHAGARPWRIAGRPAAVAPMPLFQGVSSSRWGHIATWHVSPVRVVEVAVRGGTAEETARLAALIRGGGRPPALPADALGAQTEPLHVGNAESEQLGWVVQYGVADGFVTVAGRPFLRDDFELLRLYAVASRPTTVEGTPAVRFSLLDPRRGPFGVAWRTGDNQLVTVLGVGASEEAVDGVVGATRQLTEAEWTDLLSADGDCLGAP